MNWLVRNEVGKAKDEFTAVERGVIKPTVSIKMTTCYASNKTHAVFIRESLQEQCYTHLDDHYLNRNVVWQSDWCSEVLRQRHQQVQDGNYTLSMNR